ncbi:universal stress protein [Tsuneonella mangrovi]|uniref:universal stress protein n=1 Tax=Tsuneonella mangrovi TaxID=1982042 RepID=UPI000BA21FEC|nr:universal stress protein [Tsuneonella mangrovi]
MRIYLVIMDETPEALKALRFASRRAMKTGGNVHILAPVQRESFNAFGGVQATIEQEALDRAEVIAHSAAGSLFAEIGKMPVIAVRTGDTQKVIRQYLDEHAEVAALVLGTAAEGGPGPLVTYFSGQAGALPCPVYIVPGTFTDEDIDRLA